MSKKVRIIGKMMPLWLIAVLLVASGMGAAAGTVLAGKVTGEINVAASQAILVGAPVWADSAVAPDDNMPQQVFNHAAQGWINPPNRGIGTVADDNTAFEAAAELAIGDWTAFILPLKNASDVPLTALLTLDVPDGIEIEVYAPTGSHISNPVRIGLNTWKFVADADVDLYTSPLVSFLVVVVSLDDTSVPGYYTFGGQIQQISY